MSNPQDTEVESDGKINWLIPFELQPFPSPYEPIADWDRPSDLAAMIIAYPGNIILGGFEALDVIDPADYEDTPIGQINRMSEASIDDLDAYIKKLSNPPLAIKDIDQAIVTNTCE